MQIVLVVGVTVLLIATLLLLPERLTSEFVLALCSAVVLGLSLSAALDAYALLTGRETIGDGIQRTTRRFGLYRTGISLFLGALLGHFFWPSP